MIKITDKNEIRVRRHKSIRRTLKGTADKPRLNVYKSLSHIYAQIIDDTKGVTIVSCSTVAKGLDVSGTKKDAAKMIGAEIAKRAKEKGVNKVVFDRGGYLYTGRVQSLAEGAREGGLEF